MRFRLRTLLIAAAVAPPVLAGAWFAGVWLLSIPRPALANAITFAGAAIFLLYVCGFFSRTAR
jgi:hypothetical protein